MRWREIIREDFGGGGAGGTLDNYAPMFAASYPEGIPQYVISKIKEIRRYFKTKPQIVWALRWYRVDLLGSGQQSNELDITQLRNISSTVVASAMNGQTTSIGAMEQARYLMANMNKFQHWSGVPCQELHNFNPGYTLPTVMIPKLEAIEKTWIESRDGFVEVHEDDEKLIDFGNGWAWWMLPGGSCELEADAMGHCGNVPSKVSGDRLLSLRKKISETVWSPHLTFIMHHNGFLGEMKGRGNLKPVKRYHAMITALLVLPMIKGIVGGGYAAENNFRISELTPEEQERLTALKPGFLSHDEMNKQGHEETARQYLLARMGEDRASEIKGFLNEDTAIIDTETIDQMISYNCYDYGSLFREIKEYFDSRMIKKRDGEEADGEQVNEYFHDDYFYQVFRKYWSYMINYRASGVFLHFSEELDGNVDVCISLKDLERLGEEEGDEDGYVTLNLDAIEEYRHDSWEDIGDHDWEDNITEDIVHWMVVGSNKGGKLNKIEHRLLTSIISKYVPDEVEDGFSRTQPHPDQHEFDL